jgi:NTE family protein
MLKQLILFSICLALLQPDAYGQSFPPEKLYSNLVFEGGGIRGIAYGGAIVELDKKGMLAPVERVAGTSAGAITATLMALGYSAKEIADIIYQLKLQKFSDGRFIFLGGINRLVKNYGWYKGDKFTRWIEDIIEHKTGNAHITFQELHRLRGESHFRDLYITGTSLTKQRAVVFSYETYPHMKIKDAVRISMSIPLFFKAVLIDNTGNIIHKKDNQREGVEVMVDGGIIANFPIQIFDSTKYTNDQVSEENAYVFNEQTLGIRLDRTEQILYDEQQLQLAPYNIKNFTDYIGAFYTIIIESLNRTNLTRKDYERIVYIDTVNMSPKIRRLSHAQKALLFESGRDGVKAFLGRK